LPGVRGAAADAILGDVVERLAYLEEVGVPYLTLDRLARTLSGGETQRIGLARALGARLTGTLYVLDEPTIGLHPRDTDRLLRVLERLRARGNTVVIVEHERAVMDRADWIVDLGPGAGSHGGRVVYEGAPAGLLTAPDSATAPFLRPEARAAVARARARRSLARAPRLRVRGATLHNLRTLDVDVPLGGLVCVTGVSGSGKSTLVMDIIASRALGEGDARGVATIDGLDRVTSCVLVDQTPISRSRRSNPVTFIGAYDDVRALFGAEPEARRRGLMPGSFSFNVAGGRCTRCEGEGVEQIEMYWMADVTVECALCGGTRFGADALAVRYRDRTIHDVLSLTVDDALAFFHDRPRVATKLWLLQRVGLGYLTLGQPAPTLSGGEAQRLKIARELAGRPAPGALYVLDEPTVGLHMADVQRLLSLLHELIDDRGASALVIEHNLDVIADADWVIDLGPEGGDEGGRVVAAGTPEAVRKAEESRTGAALRGESATRSARYR
jgi:excinuclease ABC subunit A